MSDLIVNVRQIGNYAPVTQVYPSDTLLLQRGGLGGAYQSAQAATLISTALNTGSMPVGMLLPGDAQPGQFMASNGLSMGMGGGLAWNAYLSTAGGLRAWQASSQSALLGVSGAAGLVFSWGAGGTGAPLAWTSLFAVSPAGAASLPRGTLTVARDPAAALEVATAGWVGRTTVASFNGRRGAVNLSPADIYRTLCLDSPIATQCWVMDAIKSSTEMLLRSHPFVFGWNGRTGDVWLTLADITCVFFQPGQQPIAPNPPAGSSDNSIATTAWVSNYVADIITGEIDSQGLATQAWVQANTVASFNGRTGVVTLNITDITNAGGAPIQSPNFLGIPTALTANPGTSTAQLATTAFVMAAVSASVSGVATFNTRTGDVTLEAADLTAVGGALLASPAFTGTPTAPTAPGGTATTQLATTAFVMSEIAAMTAGVSSFNGRSGAVTLSLADVTGVGGAPIANPAFSGIPTAPTAAAGTSTTQLATTAFVTAAIAAIVGVSSFNGRTGAVTLTASDVSAAGGLTNPNVALTGVPTAPTAAAGTSTTQLATTAFVQSAIATVPPGITVSATAPASPLQGAGWYNLNDGQTYIWTGTTWAVAVNPPMPDMTGYVTTAQLTNGPNTLSAATLNQPAIVGVTNGSNAAAGDVGEVIVGNASQALSSTATVNVVTVSLTAGDWDVTGSGWWQPGSSTTMLGMQAGINTVSATMPNAIFTALVQLQTAAAGTSAQVYAIPLQRFSLTATTTIYLVMWCALNAGSVTLNGYIIARRVR